MQKLKRFYNAQEAADLLGVSQVTVYRMIRGGELPAIPMRGRYVIPAAVIDRLEADAMAQMDQVQAQP